MQLTFNWKNPVMFEMSIRMRDDPARGYYEIHKRLSDKFPGTRISLWCNDHTDILEIEADRLDSFESLQNELKTISKENNSKIISKSYMQDKFQFVTRTCICGGEGSMPLGAVFQRYNFMEIPPIIFFDGWEYHRLVGYDDADVRGLLKAMDKIGTTEVLHKNEIKEGGITENTFLVSFNSLFGELTKKQTLAMVSAIENGYYELPRRITADELAKKTGQSRSTFEEHIRKAENKVVRAMAPYMMMYARIPETRGLPSGKKNSGLRFGPNLLSQVVPVQQGKVAN